MKHLGKLKTNNVIKDDLRFEYKALKALSDKNLPNVLPLFWSEKKRWIPVCGLGLVSENTEEIDAVIYDEDTSYEDVLWDILRTDDINIFDIANIIQLLETYSPAYDRSLWARRLKIGPEQWENIKRLNEYEIEWIEFFTVKHVPLKRILNFSNIHLRLLLEPLLTLNVGINILESIANLLTDTAHCQKVPVNIIWKELQIPDILNNDEISSAQKAQAIRSKLYEMRYPAISCYRKELNEHLAHIPRISGIDLSVDQNFETPGLRLQADIRSHEDIEILRNWLKEQKDHLGKILNTQKGKQNGPE